MVVCGCNSSYVGGANRIIVLVAHGTVTKARKSWGPGSSDRAPAQQKPGPEFQLSYPHIVKCNYHSEPILIGKVALV
jgi:hypothetical protein